MLKSKPSTCVCVCMSIQLSKDKGCWYMYASNTDSWQLTAHKKQQRYNNNEHLFFTLLSSPPPFPHVYIYPLRLQHHCCDSNNCIQCFVGILLFFTRPLDCCDFVVDTVEKTRVGWIYTGPILLHDKTCDCGRRTKNNNDRRGEYSCTQQRVNKTHENK